MGVGGVKNYRKLRDVIYGRPLGPLFTLVGDPLTRTSAPLNENDSTNQDFENKDFHLSVKVHSLSALVKQVSYF